MVPAVMKVLPVDDFVLSIFFDNGEYGRLDMTDSLDFGVFNRLKDPDAFRRVRVSFDTVEWDVGVDLDPEFVYAKCDIAGTVSSSERFTEEITDSH